MPCEVKGYIFVNSAYYCNLFQIIVHLLITYNRIRYMIL